jgi:hypothetical protein
LTPCEADAFEEVDDVDDEELVEDLAVPCEVHRRHFNAKLR